MPAKEQVTREAVLDGAFRLLRREGTDALNARGIAAEVGCSTQPIYRLFGGVEALREALLPVAERFYLDAVAGEEARGYPPYKRFGMAYARLAGEEREVFRFLFGRRYSPREEETSAENILDPALRTIMTGTGLSRAAAERLHLLTWIFTHGVASLIGTGALPFDEERVSALLTDSYRAALAYLREEENGQESRREPKKAENNTENTENREGTESRESREPLKNPKNTENTENTESREKGGNK